MLDFQKGVKINFGTWSGQNHRLDKIWRDIRDLFLTELFVDAHLDGGGV